MRLSHDDARRTEASALAAADAYDAALDAGDLDAVDGWFLTDERTSRIGEVDSTYGSANIAASRRNGPPLPPDGRRNISRRCIVLTHDVAVITLAYERPRSGRHGRRTQVWLRTSPGWRIAHAHLSLEAAHP